MSRRKEIITATGTLMCALGIGFVMQSSDTSARYAAQVKAEPMEVVVPEPVEQPATGPMLDVHDITLTSALETAESPVATPAPEEAHQGVKVASLLPAPEPQPEAPAVPAAACEIVASASAADDMFVTLSLLADCLPNERVTVHHNGMMFSAVTDRTGALALQVPALAETAVFIFAFSNGEGAVAEVTVPGADDYKRVVLQWKGDVDFQLHAFEFGAEYDQNGHVWRESRLMGYRSAGYLTTLGKSTVADPLLAEVYTFPVGSTDATGNISLSIETQVSTRNCGRDIEAQSIEMEAGGGLRTRDMTLTMPACDDLGDYLVLNNVFEDLTIAAR